MFQKIFLLDLFNINPGNYISNIVYNSKNTLGILLLHAQKGLMYIFRKLIQENYIVHIYLNKIL
jgi:hypothetical protein